MATITKLDELCQPRIESPIDHIDCVDRFHKGKTLNTKTCLIHPEIRDHDQLVKDHDNCGIDCPGPDSAQVQRRIVLLNRRYVGDDRDNRGN